MSEYEDDIQLDMFNDCCICLINNTQCSIKLRCCKNELHKECLFLIFLSNPRGINETIQSQISINCPLCRTEILLINMFTLEEIVKMFRNLPDKLCKKYNINMILLTQQFTGITIMNNVVNNININNNNVNDENVFCCSSKNILM